MSNELAKKDDVKKEFSVMLDDKLLSLEKALPRDFNRSRFTQNCVAVLNNTPDLEKVNKAQLIAGLCKGAFLGLDFFNKECYLIPYGNTVQFQTDYKGEIKYVKKYAIRPIKDIYAKVVRDGDSFEEKIVEGHPTIDFKPIPFNDGEIIGAFAVILYQDGGMEYETMSKKDIENVRATFSKAKNSKAWTATPEEMYKKTVLRRACKHCETNWESVEAKLAWEEGSDADLNTVNRKVDTNIVENPFQVVEDDGSITEVVD